MLLPVPLFRISVLKDTVVLHISVSVYPTDNLSQSGDNTPSRLLVPPTGTSSRLHCSLAKQVEG